MPARRVISVGGRAYDAITWFYPQHGQHFNPHVYVDACTGRYYE
jgi:hypothetical protein